MLFIILFYISIVIANPSTSLNEVGILYLAYLELESRDIKSINVDDIEFSIAKSGLDQRGFIENTLNTILNEYKEIDFGRGDITQLQEELDKIEPAIDKYVNGHPTYFTKGRDSIVMAISDDINFRNNINTKSFDVNFKEVFNLNKEVKGFSSIISICSSIVNKYGNDESIKKLNYLSEQSMEKRLKKIISSGQIYDKLSDEVKKSNPLNDATKVDIRGKGNTYLHIKNNYEYNSPENRITTEEYKSNPNSDKANRLKDNIKVYNSDEFYNLMKKLVKVPSNFDKKIDDHYRIVFKYNDILENKNFMEVKLNADDISAKIKTMCLA